MTISREAPLRRRASGRSIKRVGGLPVQTAAVRHDGLRRERTPSRTCGVRPSASDSWRIARQERLVDAPGMNSKRVAADGLTGLFAAFDNALEQRNFTQADELYTRLQEAVWECPDRTIRTRALKQLGRRWSRLLKEGGLRFKPERPASERTEEQRTQQATCVRCGSQFDRRQEPQRKVCHVCRGSSVSPSIRTASAGLPTLGRRR